MHKNAEKLREKLTAKFPVTTPGCSMVKIAHLDDVFSDVFEPQASPVEAQSLQKKKKRRNQKRFKTRKA